MCFVFFHPLRYPLDFAFSISSHVLIMAAWPRNLFSATATATAQHRLISVCVSSFNGESAEQQRSERAKEEERILKMQNRGDNGEDGKTQNTQR